MWPTLLVIDGDFTMHQFDTIIRNGTIVDGSGSVPAFKADLAIKNGKIAQIGGRIWGSAKQELDATGCIVAPGAIETHGHFDHHIFWDPYCTPNSANGVTTVSIGTCGFGWAPCRDEDREAYTRIMSRIVSVPPASLQKWMPWDWHSFPEFLESIDRLKLGVNVASMVPISPLRAYVMGVHDATTRTEMTDAELTALKTLFREAMDAGAWGFSGHRNPEDRTEDGGLLPSQVAAYGEFYALAEVLREYGCGSAYWTGGGSEGNEKEFMREICRISGRPMQWTGVVQARDDAHDMWREELAWSEENAALGIPLFAQVLAPNDMQFRLAEFNLFDSCPAWAAPLLGTREERLAKLQAPGVREAMKKDFAEGLGHFHGDWTAVFIKKAATEKYRKYEGKSLADIAQSLGGVEPVDAFLDISIEEGLLTEFHVPFFTGSNEDASSEMLRAKSTIPSVSDNGAHYRFLSAGYWPTYFLARFVRDRKDTSLELAHYKMSALPAWVMGYRDRGILREGMAADIMVYELDRLSYSESFTVNDLPNNEPRLMKTTTGFRWVLVNGGVAFENDAPTGVLTGKHLRSTEYQV